MAKKGFFTDATLCIGCKACEVACKQWNQLPDDGFTFTGMSYDNTGHLGASSWRHVAFVEKPGEEKLDWLMVSDVCKHCRSAACLEVCPTGAIVRTEFDSVFLQPDVCNGCGYCVSACPFGVVARREDDGRAWKCTLCYDRQKVDLTPACAQACPTESIVFGDLEELAQRAERRVEALHARGETNAYLYGKDEATQPGTGGLNAFFLLTERPEVYNLPPDPVTPTKRAGETWAALGVAAAGLLLASFGVVLAARGGDR